MLLFLLCCTLPVQALLEAHGFGRPIRDPTLDAVAAELAERVELDEGEIAAGQLRFTLGRLGVADARVQPIFDPDRHLPAVLGQLDRRFPPTDCGLATRERGGQPRTVLVLVHRGVRLDTPLPRTVEVNEIRHLRGELRAGYFHPRLLVAPPPPLPVRELLASGEGRSVDVLVAFNGSAGVWGVELVADSEYGPVVLTNQRVYVGQPPPTLPQISLSPGPTRQPPGPVLEAWIQQLRADHRLSPLITDHRLTVIAEAHAQELEKRNALLHLSPDTGTLTTRLKANGIVVLATAENLARADDVRGAMRAFLDSPGHLRNLLLPEVTHLGVGVAGRYYAVVLVRLPLSSRRRLPSGTP